MQTPALGGCPAGAIRLHPALRELAIHGKGNKERMVYPFGGDAAEWEGPLFVRLNKGGWMTRHGLSHSAVCKLLGRRKGEASITEELTPQDLRHSFATDLFRAEVPGPTVRRMMGRANLNTTERYDMSGAGAEREASRDLYIPYNRRFGR